MDIAKLAAETIRLQYQRTGDGRTFKTEEARRRELAAAGRSGAEPQVPGTIQYRKGVRLPASKAAAALYLAALLGGPGE